MAARRSHEFQLGAASFNPLLLWYLLSHLRFTPGNRCKRLIASSQTIFDPRTSKLRLLARNPLSFCWRSWEGRVAIKSVLALHRKPQATEVLLAIGTSYFQYHQESNIMYGISDRQINISDTHCMCHGRPHL